MPPQVDAEQRMLMALYLTLQDRPTHIDENDSAEIGNLAAKTDQAIHEGMTVFTADSMSRAEPLQVFPLGQRDVDYTQLEGSSDHMALLVPLARRLEGMGYEVVSIRVGEGSGYEFQLRIGDTDVTAQLYPAGETGGRQSFMSGLQSVASVLRSDAGGGVQSVDLASNSETISYRMNGGGTIFLLPSKDPLASFQAGNRAYQTLNISDYAMGSEILRSMVDQPDPTPQAPRFTGNVEVASDGNVRVSYWDARPGTGDVDWVELGPISGLSSHGLRSRFESAVAVAFREPVSGRVGRFSPTE